MPRYIVTVFERVVVECECEIEAGDPAEAKRLALEGLYDEREVLHPGRADVEPEREGYGEPKEQEQE